MTTETEMLIGQAAEEACEIAQALSKIQRFSFLHSPPGRTETNLELLEIELSDLETILCHIEARTGLDIKREVYNPPIS